jgi:hypothetical protein
MMKVVAVLSSSEGVKGDGNGTKRVSSVFHPYVFVGRNGSCAAYSIW